MNFRLTNVMPENFRGSSGPTDIQLDPVTRRGMTLDITNCPHCGRGHASLRLEEYPMSKAPVIKCPARGGAPIFLTFSVSGRV